MQMPGFAEERRHPENIAPDFLAIADDRKTLTTELLAAFLRRPHFPMGDFFLSQSGIQKLIAIIEGLKVGSAGR